MKKKTTLFLLLNLLCAYSLFAQIPNTFQFQAVIRNNDGSIQSNNPLEAKIRIRQASAQGTIIYEENHITSTNAAGIVNLLIGSGNNTSNSFVFADIDWASDIFFLEILINRENGYVTVGSQQLLSVPYAKYARNAENVHIKSPNGKLWKISVDNNGVISATQQ